MSGELVSLLVSNVLGSSFAGPSLDEIVIYPVPENHRKLPFQGVPVNPRFSGRPTNSVTDDSNRNLQTVTKLLGEPITDGGHSGRSLRRRCFPSRRAKINQVFHRINSALGPFDIIGLPIGPLVI